MFKIQFCQFPELGAVAIGVKIHGAELMPRPHHAGSHVNDTENDPSPQHQSNFFWKRALALARTSLSGNWKFLHAPRNVMARGHT
jgi:hypothetical protein